MDCRLFQDNGCLDCQWKTLIVDLDLDFRQLPVNHPDFEKLGTRDPGVSRAYTAALQLANQITLASEPAAEEMAKEGFNVVSFLMVGPVKTPCGISHS
jgi:hypothetical protein